MQNYSAQTTGFVALTITELLLQECVLKGVLSEKDVKRLLNAAARRHECAAKDNQDKIDLNMEAAHMIHSLQLGLVPLFKQQKKTKRRKVVKKSNCSDRDKAV